jgi:hypothetical protein
MGPQIIQHDVQLLAGMSRHDFVHEVEEFAASPPLVMACLKQAFGHILLADGASERAVQLRRVAVQDRQGRREPRQLGRGIDRLKVGSRRNHPSATILRRDQPSGVERRLRRRGVGE